MRSTEVCHLETWRHSQPLCIFAHISGCLELRCENCEGHQQILSCINHAKKKILDQFFCRTTGSHFVNMRSFYDI